MPNGILFQSCGKVSKEESLDTNDPLVVSGPEQCCHRNGKTDGAIGDASPAVPAPRGTAGLKTPGKFFS